MATCSSSSSERSAVWGSGRSGSGRPKCRRCYAQGAAAQRRRSNAENAPGRWRNWIHLEGQHAEIEAAVVDLALRVGQQALDAGDFDTTRGAVTAGLLGCPYDERLYQLGMKAAAGRGATGEIRALRRQLEQTLDDELEPDDTLLAGTKQLYRELLDAERSHQR